MRISIGTNRTDKCQVWLKYWLKFFDAGKLSNRDNKSSILCGALETFYAMDEDVGLAQTP